MYCHVQYTFKAVITMSQLRWTKFSWAICCTGEREKGYVSVYTKRAIKRKRERERDDDVSKLEERRARQKGSKGEARRGRMGDLSLRGQFVERRCLARRKAYGEIESQKGVWRVSERVAKGSVNVRGSTRNRVREIERGIE